MNGLNPRDWNQRPPESLGEAIAAPGSELGQSVRSILLIDPELERKLDSALAVKPMTSDELDLTLARWCLALEDSLPALDQALAVEPPQGLEQRILDATSDQIPQPITHGLDRALEPEPVSEPLRRALEALVPADWRDGIADEPVRDGVLARIGAAESTTSGLLGGGWRVAAAAVIIVAHIGALAMILSDSPRAEPTAAGPVQAEAQRLAMESQLNRLFDLIEKPAFQDSFDREISALLNEIELAADDAIADGLFSPMELHWRADLDEWSLSIPEDGELF
ncbi:MAG: hypothetical protein JJU36_07705 [Phycisphaeraceae bacterium]|nr:hypothetical protein [Phycisphaeraceae bacterium]